MMRRWIVAAALAVATAGVFEATRAADGTAPAAPATQKAADLTAGWKPEKVEFDIHKPYDLDAALRHSYDPKTDIHDLFVLKGDKPHAPPPNTTAPRTELRFKNDYTTGEHMFDADCCVVAGTYSCIMQIWGSGVSSTTLMILAHPDGTITCYDNKVLRKDLNDKWFNLKVDHNTQGAGTIKVYIDNELAGTFAGRGMCAGLLPFYLKCGVYSCRNGDRAETKWRNIRLWENPANAGAKPAELQRSPATTRAGK